MVSQHNNSGLVAVLKDLAVSGANIPSIGPIVAAFNYTLGSVAKVLINAYGTGAEVILEIHRTNANISIRAEVIDRQAEYAPCVAPAHALVSAYHDYIEQVRAQFEGDPEAIEIAKLLAQKVLVDALGQEGYPVLISGNEVKLLLKGG
jgi:hypothetical protein